jgi:hypothetical protein
MRGMNGIVGAVMSEGSSDKEKGNTLQLNNQTWSQLLHD